MAENRYLNQQGLQTLWNKIGSTFVRQTDLGDVAMKSEIYGAMDGIDFKLNSETSMIQLIVPTSEGNRTLEVSYAEFIKDNMLSSVSLIEIPSDGEPATSDRPAGTYIKFEFKVDGGVEPLYLNVSDVMKVYDGSDYITVDAATGVISLNLDALKPELTNYFNTLYASKTELQEVSSAVANKADKTYVDEELAKKANQDALDGLSSNISQIGTNLTAVEAAYKKADEEFNTRLEAVESSTTTFVPITDEEINNLQ